MKQIFWKTKTFFKKPEYCFLAESTTIEDASFPYKTAISEVNVKANKMVTTKWTYHKERKRELPFENGKIALVHASMVVTFYIKFFRTRAERHNGILMSLLLLVAKKIILFDAELSVEKVRCGRVTLIEVLNNYGLVKLVIFTVQKNEVLR